MYMLRYSGRLNRSNSDFVSLITTKETSAYTNAKKEWTHYSSASDS